MAIAGHAHTCNSAGQLGVGAVQVGHRLVAPVRPGVGQQLQAGDGLVTQGAVVCEHSGAWHGEQALVGCTHVAQTAPLGLAARRSLAILTGCATVGINHVVPRGSGTAPVEQRVLEVEVGDHPGGVAHGFCGILQGLLQRRRGVDHHAGGHKNGQGHHAAPRQPALQLAGGGVQRKHLHAVAGGFYALHHLAGFQAVTQWRSQAGGEPAVALGPGENWIGLRRILRNVITRRSKAVAPGKVVQPGPGRHGGQACAVVVAATVVQVPAQVRVGQALGVQPCVHGESIQFKLVMR